MKKLSKRNIESNLPVEFYSVINRHKMTGADLLKTGHGKKGLVEDTKEINPELDYMVKIPGSVQKNHFRRMRKLFLRYGPTELYKYIVNYVKEERRPEVLKYIHSMEY